MFAIGLLLSIVLFALAIAGVGHVTVLAVVLPVTIGLVLGFIGFLLDD